MHEETVLYRSGDKEFKGYLAYDQAVKAKKRPAVIVAHAWRGQDDFAREKARELAKLGYVGFAADVFGNGLSVDNNEEASALITPLFLDRQLLRDRIRAAYDTVYDQKMVDKDRIGAIGFCFGGLTVIELLRSGADLRGVVSFHGILGDTFGKNKAKLAPNAKQIKGALLMLHGHDDPLVSREDIYAIETEFTKAGVDWQIHIYGHAVHAFTNPVVHDVKSGMAFNEKANHRSWQSMRNFFDEVFK